MDSKEPRRASESSGPQHAEELIPVAPATAHSTGLDDPGRASRAETAAALRELGGALNAIRDSVRAATGGDGQGAALEVAALPALERLADAVDGLSVDPDALTNALRGPSAPPPSSLMPFGAIEVGSAPSVTPNEDGGFAISAGPVDVNVSTSGASIDTPFGSAGVDGQGAHVNTPAGSASIDTEGNVTVTSPNGNTVKASPPGSSSAPEGTDSTGDPPNPVFTAAPFEVTIPVPTFVVQPLEIPIPVPKFTAECLELKVPVPKFTSECLELKVPVPKFTSECLELKVPVPSFQVDPLPIPLPYPSFLSHPFELPPWLPWFKGFPDVHMTPAPPFGPVPIPYPNFAAPWNSVSGFVASATYAVTNAVLGVAEFVGGTASSVATAVGAAVAKVVTLVGQNALSGVAGFPLPEPPAWLEAPATWVAEAGRAVARAVPVWMTGATVHEGQIYGIICIVPPGSLRGSVDFESTLAAQLALEGVPPEFAGPVSRALARAWDDWFAGFQGVLTYPAFAAFPGPQAPPIPNVPMPLIACGGSSGAAAMTPDALEAALTAELDGTADAADLEPSVRQLARWFSERFLAWTASVQVMNVLGSGPVPVFAPPSVPFGPVIGGTVTPTPGVLAGGNAFEEFAPWGAGA